MRIPKTAVKVTKKVSVKTPSLAEAKAKKGGMDKSKASMLKKELSPKFMLKKTLVKKTKFVPKSK